MKTIIIPGVITGFCLLVVSLVWNMILGALFPSLVNEYTKTGLFRPWTDPIMSLYFIYPFVVGIVLAYAWMTVKKYFTDESSLRRGLHFGWWYFILATIPGMFITYSSFQVSLLMLSTWTLSGLIEAIVAGLVLAKLRR